MLGRRFHVGNQTEVDSNLYRSLVAALTGVETFRKIIKMSWILRRISMLFVTVILLCVGSSGSRLRRPSTFAVSGSVGEIIAISEHLDLFLCLHRLHV